MSLFCISQWKQIDLFTPLVEFYGPGVFLRVCGQINLTFWTVKAPEDARVRKGIGDALQEIGFPQ